MNESEDWELLREYAIHDSESAFTELVRRHVNLVYAAALRQLCEDALAEEVTQVVFIALAKKARGFRTGTNLCAWLHRATRFAALNALKAERRRQQREQKAIQMQTMTADGNREIWETISPTLDTALCALREKDRAALLLRYFENKTLAEVGRALGTSEEAAKKRVSRALNKLNSWFSRRGFTFSGAVISSLLLSKASEAAPPALANSTATIASASASCAPALLLGAAEAALRSMFWASSRVFAIAAGGLTAGFAAIAFCIVSSGEAKLPPTLSASYEFEVSGEIQKTSYFGPGPNGKLSHPKVEGAKFIVSVRKSNWFVHLVKDQEPSRYYEQGSDGKAIYVFTRDSSKYDGWTR